MGRENIVKTTISVPCIIEGTKKRPEGEDMDDNTKEVPKEILEEIFETKEFQRVFGMTAMEILKKAEEACRENKPLTGEQALNFADLISSWIRIADSKSTHSVKFEFMLEVVRGHQNYIGMKNMVKEHQAFITDLIETAEFFRGVAALGLVAPRDEAWFEEARYFFCEDEDENGYCEGLRFPSRVIRNWALATYGEDDPSLEILERQNREKRRMLGLTC